MGDLKVHICISLLAAASTFKPLDALFKGGKLNKKVVNDQKPTDHLEYFQLLNRLDPSLSQPPFVSITPQAFCSRTAVTAHMQFTSLR